VIGLLAREPAHGYALFARIQRDLDGVWQVGMNRLYALLEAMERDGLVKGHAERGGLRPARRVFHATAKGSHLFERWMHEPSHSMRDMRVDFPPKLYFAQSRGLQDVAELVQGQRAACRDELARIVNRRAALVDPDDYRHLVYDLRLRQIDSILAWLDDCERRLVSPRITTAGASATRRKAA
jgi:DNA-binding PadR family transcriptional regulator